MLAILARSIFSKMPSRRPVTATVSAMTTRSTLGLAFSARSLASISVLLPGVTSTRTLCFFWKGSMTSRVRLSWYCPALIMMLSVLVWAVARREAARAPPATRLCRRKALRLTASRSWFGMLIVQSSSGVG